MNEIPDNPIHSQNESVETVKERKRLSCLIIKYIRARQKEGRIYCG